jgi:PAS domain S-box-containing protein
MIILDLIHNIALLVALATVYQVIEARWHMRRLASQFLYGLLFGAVGVLGMMTPVHFMPGIIFDGRSIILSVGGLFGGPIVALIAALMCGAYRLWLGGAGAAMGLSVVMESAALGVAFHYWRRRMARPLGLIDLWSFGLLVHGVMLGMILLLPGGARQAAWRQLGLAIVGIYPVATMLICRLFLDYEKQRQEQTALKESEEKHRVVIETTATGFVIVDAKGCVLDANSHYVQLTGHEKLEQILGRSVTGWTAAYDQARNVAEIKKCIANGAVWGLEIDYVHPDGTVVPIEINASTLGDGGSLRIVTLCQDITDRRRAEAELKRQRAELQLILDAVPALIFFKDRQHRILRVNRELTQLVGEPHEALEGRTAEEYGSPYAEQYHRDEEEIFASGQPKRGLIEPLQTVRGMRWLQTDKLPYYDATGQIVGVVGFALDITERMRSEKELERERNLLRTLIDHIPDSIYVRDTANRFLIANDAVARRMGAAGPEALLGKTDADFYPAEQAACFAAADGEVLAGRELVNREENIIFPGGERRVILTTKLPLLDARGAVTALVGIGRDITEWRQAEEQSHKQAALLNAATDAIYLRTLDNTVTYWNEAAALLYDRPPAEALGRKITDLIHTDRTAFAAAQATLLEQGHWSGELIKTSKLGKELVVFCRWTLLRDEQGQPKEILAINTDITEKKQLENRFLRAQRMEGIGLLAGGIAHDLNNILTPILMTMPFLRETVNDPESGQMIDTVEDCARRGADIIKQLLTFARGKPGTRAPLPIRHILKEMDKLIRETFPRNIQSHVILPEELLPVLGDATQIHQAVLNLCVNARDAMIDGGSLTLAAESVFLDEAFAAITPEAKPGVYVCVSVSDTGTGIPPEHVDLIFEPFFTTKEFGKGTGLGLATVLGIVRGHGGFVRVHSLLGRGTTFEIYLPATPEAKGSAVTDNKPLPPRAQGELIVVVDDEASVRMVVQRTLEKHGYRVLTTDDGAEALALISQNGTTVKAAITDMMMPGMDGPTLVHALRKFSPQLPILGMTGLGEQTGVKGLADLHLPVLLTKPFAGSELLAALHAAICPCP